MKCQGLLHKLQDAHKCKNWTEFCHWISTIYLDQFADDLLPAELLDLLENDVPESEKEKKAAIIMINLQNKLAE
ncbi:MAG: hypothetical protein V8S76_00670 [Lachnospiraceae bacterium]